MILILEYSRLRIGIRWILSYILIVCNVYKENISEVIGIHGSNLFYVGLSDFIQ